MTDNLPSVTVLIPTRPEQAEVSAVAAAHALVYPPDKLEILVARGKQPSVQRNTGLKAARGELIYFLDDDSIALPDNLRRAVEHFRDPKAPIQFAIRLFPTFLPSKNTAANTAKSSEMTGSPHFDDMKFFVRDLSGVTQQSIDLDSIVVAAFCNQAASTYKRKLRGAFVVTDAATRERVLHYIAESRALGTTWELRMFEDQPSANAWATQDTNPASPTN